VLDRVAVVVPTYRRPALLLRLVAALERQRDALPTGTELDVVIVDDASGDGTAATLDELARRSTLPLVVLRQPTNRGPAAARNIGWRHTPAALVAFTDDDCEPVPGWLAALIEAAGQADVVQGRTVPAPDQLARRGPFSRTLQVQQMDGLFQTCNVLYRREWLERTGGFDEQFRHAMGEDTELALRALEAGARPAFAAGAVVRHDVRPSSLAAQLRDAARWASIVLVVRKHPSARRLLHRRWLWKATHGPALLAATGGVVAAAGRSRWARGRGYGGGAATVTLAVALQLPYLRTRLVTVPLPGTTGTRQRVALLPAALVQDLAEVVVLAAASVRYRTLVL